MSSAVADASSRPGHAASGTPLLALRGLSLGLADGTPLVQDANWQLQAGETLAVVGESGSGKSLSALAIMGLLPDAVRWHAGDALFEGRSLRTLPPADYRDLRGRRLGMIFQEPMTSLNPVMRIGDQVAEVLQRHQGLSRRAALERAVALLDGVQIPQAATRVAHYPHQLSGGQRQRVMIATALACDPALLVADEPTTALDVTVQAEILRLIAEQQQRRNLAVLLITHDLSVVAQAAHRVVVMYAGRIMESGPATQVLRAPAHPYTQGLLQARPSARQPRTQRLAEIPGMVATPSRDRQGCPFAARCAQALPRCTGELPPVTEVAAGQHSACWRHVAG